MLPFDIATSALSGTLYIDHSAHWELRLSQKFSLDEEYL